MHRRWCQAARTVNDPITKISAGPRNDTGDMCAAFSHSTITLDHGGEKKCCDFGGISEQSKEDLSGRPRRKITESQLATQQKSQLAIDINSEIDWTLWV